MAGSRIRYKDPRHSSSQAKTSAPIESDDDLRNLIQKTLLPDKKHNTLDDLPALTSSSELDLQLHALIAIIIKEFVQKWYTTITTDQDFVAEILQIIAHCTTQLEQRLRKLDLEHLLLWQLPDLLQRHLDAHRISLSAHLSQPELIGQREMFLALRPHVALQPVGEDAEAVKKQMGHEAAYRTLLAQGILAVLLPPEDLQNACLQVLVRDLLADLILGRVVGGTIAEPWFIYEVVGKLLEAPLLQNEGTRFAKKGPAPARRVQQRTYGDRTFVLLWQVASGIYLCIISVIAFFNLLLTARRLPSRNHASSANYSKWPMYSSPVLSLISSFLDLRFRSPWLVSTFSLIMYFIQPLVVYDSVLDKACSHVLHEKLFQPELLNDLVRVMRTTLFPPPRYTLGPARPLPSLDDQHQIRETCVDRILGALPSMVRSRFFATSDDSTQRRDIESMLDLFAENYRNKSLIYSIIGLCIGNLLPELTAMPVSELVSEKCSPAPPNG